MKRKLTIQVRKFRHVCTLQNTCRPHLIKTIKRHYVHIWMFLAGTFGARKKWLWLVEKGSYVLIRYAQTNVNYFPLK